MAAAERGTFGIPTLVSGNYQIWKIRMEMLLIKEEVWEVISTVPTPSEAATPAWKKNNDKARGLIGLLVDVGSFEGIS